MDVGKHLVRVREVKSIRYNSGNSGVEFTCENAQRQQTGIGFVLTEKSYWKLANFISACGYDREECLTWDTHNLEHHRRAINRVLWIEIEPVDKANGKTYKEATGWWRATTEEALELGGNQARTAAPRTSARPEPERQDGPAYSEDIPF